MTSTISGLRDSIEWHRQYDPQAPKRGSPPPDFELRDASGENPIRLSDFHGKKPVALIFGSFTWEPFVREAVRLQDLYAEYSDRVQFLVIYIREAHPTDGWYMGNHDIRDPQTIEERRALAGTCETRLKYGIPTIVDEMDDGVMKAYAAWPDRLYLVDLSGMVAYAGSRGPWGFKPSKLKKAVQGLMESDAKYASS